MAHKNDLVKKVQAEMLKRYDGAHAGVGISSLAVIKDLYEQGMYQLGRSSFPSDKSEGLCVTVNLCKKPGDGFTYVTELEGVHIFYRVTGMPQPY